MKKNKNYLKKGLGKYIFLAGILLGILVILGTNKAIVATSTNQYCSSCHSHPHSTTSWKLSTHYDNKGGVVIKCVECHLPPPGLAYLTNKIKFGAKDAYGEIFKDPSEIDWEEKSKLEHAVKFTFKESCVNCHQNLFPLELTKEGNEAHLYYTQIPDQIHCINCHKYVGHYDENAIHSKNIAFGKTIEDIEFFTDPAIVSSFTNFTEFIPGTGVKFDMIAIPGGSFKIGSPDNEKFRKPDEGPRKEIQISPFFMGKIEVTWDEFLAFYKQTASEGRPPETTGVSELATTADAITGATPPYGPPDQGWGMGSRPAITMTHHAAEVYCQWLSLTTGKKYRLPTEAEWEYACRGETETVNFFNITPKQFTGENMFSRLFKKGNPEVDKYVVYAGNSQGKTREPDGMEKNPFGLINMMGNVSEFCSDWYSPELYSKLSNEDLSNPKGPLSGEEHVVRGGSFKSNAKLIRSAARSNTESKEWLLTDPQIPKSIWWYSDCNFVGFRVVCEPDGNIFNSTPK
ncbi:MAG: SUMF1/EgtB/PvdO family nonheme iron enzyme [Bacteroidales bacterium]|nr:SUMF1/EgtB/PvdO family nonheme iron enzyme [Bacteroidales bacterium]